jgi:N-acyl-phosphatidylethanolamine-hydrolysing phospholipase D
MLSRNTTVPVLLLAAASFAITEPAMSDVSLMRPPHHVDGGFINPSTGAHKDPPIGVAVPFFFRRITNSLFGGDVIAPELVENDGAFLRSNAEHSVPTVTWVGHSTLLVQMGHVTFLTDPVWSDTASPLPVGPRRYVEPGLRIDELPDIDFVVVSHNHYDHMDVDTLVEFSDRGVPVLVPLENAYILERNGIETAVEFDWWESKEIAGVTVHCVPAHHWSRRGLNDMNRSLWSGWAVTAPDRTFYFAGDTGSFDGFTQIRERLGPVDLAAVPIGAYEPRVMMKPAHLNPEEAMDAVLALGAKRSVAIHFGTFDLTDEPVDEPPDRYRAASLAANRSPEQDWILDVGETRRW